MTTLEYRPVKRGKGWVLYRWVAGDLSYSYELVIGSRRYGYLPKMSDVPKALAYARRYGIVKGAEKWAERQRRGHLQFPRLRGKEARKFAKKRSAYGEYVDMLRRRK